MKFKKTLAAIAAGALSLTLGAFALAGCGISGENYTFEAEDGELAGQGLVMGQTPGPASVSNPSAYKVYGELADETLIGVENFNSAGQSITWTVTASSACKAELTLWAASSVMYFNQEDNSIGLVEIDMAATEAYKLTCNDTKADLKGKLPGAQWADWSAMQEPGAWWDLGKATAIIDLKEGENTIVFEIVSTVEGQNSAGLNIDKIVIKAPSELK
ncbi:MAG: hypothetical protein K2L42_04945 [Clostridia bacterium]|nr:hypothetical protein [Clostridia bacterium]